MSPAELVPFIQRRPFVPFRIVTSDGTTYDIPHPEMVILFPTAAMIAYRNEKVPGTFLRFDFVSMFHIVRVETLETPAQAPSQGNNEA
jgi:hypothetical protein